MNNYFKQNMEIVNANQKYNQIRNPESHTQNTIRISSEIDAQGLIPVIHTYQENGSIYHKSYQFNKDGLKQFIQNHRDSLVTVDGVEPNDVSNKQDGVDIGREMSGLETTIPEQYQRYNQYANFQPLHSFKTSFDQKYNHQMSDFTTANTNGSNISGNEVSFPKTNPSCDDANG